MPFTRAASTAFTLIGKLSRELPLYSSGRRLRSQWHQRDVMRTQQNSVLEGTHHLHTWVLVTMRRQQRRVCTYRVLCTWRRSQVDSVLIS